MQLLLRSYFHTHARTHTHFIQFWVTSIASCVPSTTFPLSPLIAYHYIFRNGNASPLIKYTEEKQDQNLGLIFIRVCIDWRDYSNFATSESTRWFKYDRDYLCVNKSQFVPVISEPPSNLTTTKHMDRYKKNCNRSVGWGRKHVLREKEMPTKLNLSLHS
jgi:hypothetical protein